MDKSRKALIAILTVLAVINGILMIPWVLGFDMTWFDIVMLVLLISSCALVVIRSRRCLISLVLVLRFLFAAAVGLSLILWSPWSSLTSLGAYASGTIGLMLVSGFTMFVTAFCCSVILFFVASSTTMFLPKFSAIWFLKFLLLVVVISIVGMMEGLIVAILINTASSPYLEILYAVDGFTSQILYSFAYYYLPKNAPDIIMHTERLFSTAGSVSKESFPGDSKPLIKGDIDE